MSTRHDMLVELVTDQINSIEQMIRDDEYDDVHHWLHPILLRKLKLDYADWSDDDLKNYYCDQLGVDIPEVPTLSSDDEETEELVKACFGQAPSQETANRGSLPLTEEQRFIHGAAADAQQVPEGMALYKGEFVTARMVVERLAKAESAYLSAWARLVKEERLHGYAMEERDHAEEMADKLADAIATLLGVEIGEHSNMNCPWEQALEAFEERAASTVTQDAAP